MNHTEALKVINEAGAATTAALADAEMAALPNTCRHEWELIRESAYADGRKVTRIRCQLCPEERVERTQATAKTVSGDYKDFSLVAATRLGVTRWI